MAIETAEQAPPKTRLIIPEVIQTSNMDCGPASLKALLGGYGVDVSYGRLREACQTDVDGTSIDTLEELAVQLGIDAEQVMVPTDHLLLAEAKTLPAIVVIELPNGFTHFVVVWRVHANRFVQIMDPAVGRRWMRISDFMRIVHRHTFAVPADGWREYAGSDDFLSPLRRRLANSGIDGSIQTDLIDNALRDSSWWSLAYLDAATRMTTALVKANGLRQGKEASAALTALINLDDREQIPAAYWSVHPSDKDSVDVQELFLSGAVLVRTKGVRDTARQSSQSGTDGGVPPLSAELTAALADEQPNPGRLLWDLVKQNGVALPIMLAIATLFAAGGVLLESIFLRRLIDNPKSISLLGTIIGLLIFMGLFRGTVIVAILRIGRELDSSLRQAFWQKIPKLPDRYFYSRLTSDMAQRGHLIYRLRQLPVLVHTAVQTAGLLIMTTIGLIWLHPAGAWITLLTLLAICLIPFLIYPLQAERDLRARTYKGSLTKYYLDSLQMLVPIRAHTAEPAIRREHATLLSSWRDTAFSLVHFTAIADTLQLLLVTLGVAGLIAHYNAQVASPDLLLLSYWGLNLIVLGRAFAGLVRQYPLYRNSTLRAIEPLGALEDEQIGMQKATDTWLGTDVSYDDLLTKGVHLSFDNVTVQASSHTILRDFNLTIGSGEHVAIVGRSGAGKSTFVGLLLGWHRPAKGTINSNGMPLDTKRIAQLRQMTAWVDPSVHLWNETLAYNLTYGSENSDQISFSPILDRADLFSVLGRLPDGMESDLGESGRLVSGGEGQRVRFGRALVRRDAKLVILDEPFRGLDRELRQTLLNRARAYWADATLICITHDVAHTRGFGRVLVIDDGKLAEDGTPYQLANQPDSIYGELLHLEQEVAGLWASSAWRNWELDQGVVHDGGLALPPIPAPSPPKKGKLLRRKKAKQSTPTVPISAPTPLSPAVEQPIPVSSTPKPVHQEQIDKWDPLPTRQSSKGIIIYTFIKLFILFTLLAWLIGLLFS